MGKQAKFSQCESVFVFQHEMARDCEPVIQLIQHIPHGGNGEGKLPKFHYKLAFEFFEGVSSHLAPATGRKVALLAPSQDESAI